MTTYCEHIGALADRILDEVGGNVVLGLPLGLGKANHIANELYARAAADPGIRLRIFTALTLEPLNGESELGRRFLEPLNDRLFAGYPRLTYMDAVRDGTLPANVDVYEFFLQAGRWLNVPLAQQNYICANYSHAPRYLADRGVNVIAQLVAKEVSGVDTRFSLSCNPDITLDLLPRFVEKRKRGEAALLVGQVNSELPFMGGDAIIPTEIFDHILEGKAYEFPLFGTPRLPLSDADHAIGLRCATLIPDGGTLEIGIGSVGDAVTYALCLRHQHNLVFRKSLERLDTQPGGDRSIALTPTGALEPFSAGLYAMSEMFVEGFLDLYRAGILKREVEDGAILHAAFFLGSRAFYRTLREMPMSERDRFRMMAVSFVNEVYGQEDRKRLARTKARFVNTAMMVTALGAAISDTLDDGRVVSGVGGQHDLVSQAFALGDARSLITLPATRRAGRRTVSNILWYYGQATVPRHLRDIVITEYGIADLRGKADRDCIAAMIAISDSRFQEALLTEAKAAGKIEEDYEIPARYTANVPDRIANALESGRAQGHFSSLPFGSDFTEEERALLPALAWLREASTWSLIRATLGGIFAEAPDDMGKAALARLRLAKPGMLKEHLMRAALVSAMSQRHERP